MVRYILLNIVVLILVSFFSITQVEASEGIVELKGVNGSNARCFVMSTSLNRASSYRLLIQCRDLIYPIEKEGRYYILWAHGGDEQSASRRIGDIAFGTVSLTARAAFSRMSITKEQTQSPREPSSNTVMKGAIKPISFLNIKPSPSKVPPTSKKPTPKVTQKPKTSPTPTPKPQSFVDTIFSVIRTIVIIIIVLTVIIIVIYLIYKFIRSRTE